MDSQAAIPNRQNDELLLSEPLLSWSDVVTEYDEAHLFTYASLLDAAAAGLSRRQMIESILGLDWRHAASDKQLSLHLERAQWMRRTGYILLLSE